MKAASYNVDKYETMFRRWSQTQKNADYNISLYNVEKIIQAKLFCLQIQPKVVKTWYKKKKAEKWPLYRQVSSHLQADKRIMIRKNV